MKKPLVVFFLVLGALSPGRGQELKFRRLEAAQALPNNTVFCFAQDGHGFVWIGTQHGLSRYDGYRLKTYLADPRDPKSLTENEIRALVVDRKKNLWIGTLNGGLCRYDDVRDRFARYLHDAADPGSLSDNNVFSLWEDRQGTLWVGTSKGLCALDADRRVFKTFRHDPRDKNSLSNGAINSILEDRNGLLWIGTDDGVTSFDRKEGRFRRFHFEWTNPANINPNNVHKIYEDRKGNILVGTPGGIFSYNPEKEAFNRYPPLSGRSDILENNSIWGIQEDAAGTLWIAGNRGLIALDPQTGECSLHQSDPSRPDSLVHNTVIALFLDRTGLLWIGTTWGISFLTSFHSSFDLWQSIPGQAQSLSSSDVFGLCEDRRGILWVGTSAGLDRVDRGRNRITRFQHDPRLASCLSAGPVLSVLEDQAGRLWVGTYGGGLNLMDREKGTFSHFVGPPHSPPGVPGAMVISICEDQWGGLWVGTSDRGLTKLEPPANKGAPFAFKAFLSDPENPKSISSDRVSALLEDRRGVLWVGTDGGGVNEYRRDRDEFFHHVFDPDDPESLSSNYVLSLLEDSAGNIWVGTRGGGLNRLDPLTGRCRRYGSAQGLPSDSIIGLLEDAGGQLWLSTDRGLAEFNPVTGNVIVYTEEDGLQGDHFNINSRLRTRDGELFFGGSNGLNLVRPGRLNRNPYPPPLVITDLLLTHRTGADGEPLSLFPMTRTGEIELSYGDRFFAVEFAALDFNDPLKNQYAWILEGRDKDWSYLGHARRVVFNDLRPGTYKILVKGSNNSGVWNEEGAALKITIRHPWWRSWFFLFSIALALALAAAFLLGFRRRYRYLKSRGEVNVALFCARHEISARECDIIRLVLEGRTYQEIADKLYISPKTVKSHIYHIYQKLGVGNRLQLSNLVRMSPTPSQGSPNEKA